MCLFILQLQWLLSYQQFSDFSLINSCKTYLGPMRPPGSINWQLISPHQYCCKLEYLSLSVPSALASLLNAGKNTTSRDLPYDTPLGQVIQPCMHILDYSVRDSDKQVTAILTFLTFTIAKSKILKFQTSPNETKILQ